MPFDTAFTLGMLIAVTIALALELLTPDTLLLGALALLTVGGIIDLQTAFAGFSNLTLVAIGSLYVVAAGLREVGALDRASHLLFGRDDRGPRRTLLRMTPIVAVTSAFLNNTPVVAMGVPSARGWARRNGARVSKLLMPLSFASILGGLCTVIGTSTNLVTDGLLRSRGYDGLAFFELAWIGLPCAFVGLVYLVVVAPRILPDRSDVRTEEEEERRHLLEVSVEEGSSLIGRTVADDDLSEPPGLTLRRIERGPRTLEPVAEAEHVTTGDRLLYSGTRHPGETTMVAGEEATLRTPEVRESGEEVPELHQAVVPAGSRFVGATIAEVAFPERYNAAITGVRRGGRRLREPFDDLHLRPGDTLMLDTGTRFRETFEDSHDIYVATEEGGEGVDEEVTPHDEPAWKAWTASFILGGVVGLAATGVAHIALASLLGALAIVALGFVTPGEARESVDWSVLLVIGAAIGLASAMDSSGAARLIGSTVVEAAGGFGGVGLVAGLVLATMLTTGLITNNAAVALMLPVAISVAENQAALDPRPLVLAVTVAASLALWTPLGYQTNLMVYGPGNYRFTDFVRLGLPLQLILAVVIIVTAYVLWL
ncbi:MAG: SLC13 family permease [Gemmatimonadota bacterium]